MAVPHRKRYTVEEFEAFADAPENADRLFELIDGEIVEKVPTELHAVIAARISGELYIYLKLNPSAGRIAVEPRHKMPNDAHNSRLPDVAFTSAERALPIVKRGSVPQMPDLAIEIKSPDDSYTRMRKKAEYYLANGVRLVWLVFPEKQFVEVYRPDMDLDIKMLNETLDGADVLPGFTLAVKDIFAEL
jgi:Uma2 family endonuclease